MYIRVTTRRNQDGSSIRYLALAHNVRDEKTGTPKAQVIHNLGREDSIDKEALSRLIRSISRFVEPEQALAARGSDELAFIRSRPMGATWLLDGLWRRLGIEGTLLAMLEKRSYQAQVERILFALVANRAVAPGSKRAAAAWAEEDTVLPDMEKGAGLHNYYRAMDFLLSCQEDIQREVFFCVANLFNLEVDLIFLDTTSTYFETDDTDDLRKYGHSKDHRDDRPQTVIALAVTKDGIPVRCWSFPGNVADQSIVEKVKKEMGDWRLGRLVWCLDRGFSSKENKRYLTRGGDHYIVGEKLRTGDKAKAALARAGRYQVVKQGLKVKEITVEGARYVLCHSEETAQKDRLTRERHLGRLAVELSELKQLKGAPHKKGACVLRAHQSLGRYLKQNKDGRLKINRSKVKEEEKLDGKYLLSTSDTHLSAADVALGWKRLSEVERAFRDLKQTLELRPIYHRKEERIRAHVTLCWLALLLIRIAETETAKTWRFIRGETERIHLGTFVGKAGRIEQRTEITPGQKAIFNSLHLKEPPLFFDLTPKNL